MKREDLQIALRELNERQQARRYYPHITSLKFKKNVMT